MSLITEIGMIMFFAGVAWCILVLQIVKGNRPSLIANLGLVVAWIGAMIVIAFNY